MNDMIPVEKLKFYMERESDRDCAAGYICEVVRLNNAFILLTKRRTHAHAEKMFLTRHGAGIKNDCDGDASQIDLQAIKIGLKEAVRILNA